MIVVRRADATDARAIAEVHVKGWQWAYRGQLPDAHLDALSIAARAEMWASTLAAETTPMRVWLAEKDTTVVGFANTGLPQDGEHPPRTAELQAIYLAGAEVAGTGVGRALHDRALDDLRERGFEHVFLWVLDTNTRARRFYERAGWQTDNVTKSVPRKDFDLHEIRYTRALGATIQGA